MEQYPRQTVQPEKHRKKRPSTPISPEPCRQQILFCNWSRKNWADMFSESLTTGDPQDLHLRRFTSRIREHYKEDAVTNALLEAWAWLVREGLLDRSKRGLVPYFLAWKTAPRPSGRSSISKIKRSFEGIASPDYRRSGMAELHPRHEYDTAVFQAFKEVELVVRTAAGLQATDVGQDLMGKAFNSNSGPLADRTLPEAERQAMLASSLGALSGSSKTLSSHRHMVLSDSPRGCRNDRFRQFTDENCR